MRDYFYCLLFPHPLNNHRAKYLHFRTFFLVISILIISTFCFNSQTSPFYSKIKAFADISTQELLRFTNIKREENGLAPLKENTQLEEAASKKADDMFQKDYWAHNAPDGTTPWVFIKNAGYEYVYAGENLARGFINSEDVVNAWMASPAHRENMLSANFNEVGFSVKSGKLNGEDTFLVVQEFGNKTALPAEKIVANNPPKSLVLGINPESLVPKPANTVSYDFVLIIIISFIGVLLFDLIVVKRKNIIRFVGHNVDHVLFLFVIIIFITIISSGHIL
jgi:uncharacterized protein YkwD